MKIADYFETLDSKRVSCILCPHNCIIENGKSGFCRVRKNINGVLYSLNYGKISAVNVDSIEKKPLFHFYPGKKILSIGSIGCNLHCSFCQNYEISQFNEQQYSFCKELSLEKIVEYAQKTDGNIGLAYTYNEPTVFFEYMAECAREIKKKNMLNISVTNGYIQEKPLKESFEYIDAYSVDLKSFSNKFYKDITGGTVEPVKNNLKLIKKFGKHLEIENLIIPELNDEIKEFEEMVKWISGELGENTILHINRYYPAYLLKTAPSPESKFIELYKIAKKYLKYVYVGNVETDYGQDTFCGKCGNLIIKREGYNIKIEKGNENGKCSKCGEKIFIV